MKFVSEHPGKYGTHKGIRIADDNIGSTRLFDTYPLYSPAFLRKDADPLAADIPEADTINRLFRNDQ